MPRGCADCTTTLFDPLGIYTNPTDHYWNVVNGGAGVLGDAVDGPDGLTSLWTYGGSPSASGLQSSIGSDSLSFAIAPGTQTYFSIVLDTATGPVFDMTLPSWGTISNLNLTPYIDGVAQTSVAMSWVLSSFDPDRGTDFYTDANGLQLALATNDAGAAETDAQALGIWGVSALLPGRDAASGQAYTSYSVSFDYDLSTYDNRGVVSEPATALMMVLGVAAAAAWGRRRVAVR